jgi:hypothetical protein
MAASIIFTEMLEIAKNILSKENSFLKEILNFQEYFNFHLI